MRQIAAANGDRIVKSRIDGSYQLVDAGTDKVIWPTHVQAGRIGATFNELSERIFGGDGMSARQMPTIKAESINTEPAQPTEVKRRRQVCTVISSGVLGSTIIRSGKVVEVIVHPEATV